MILYILERNGEFNNFEFSKNNVDLNKIIENFFVIINKIVD